MTPQDRQAAAAAWVRAMRRGDFPEAWAISERLLQSRAQCASSSTPRHLQQIWDGTPIDGRRLLVRCYHGLGDTIQFIRFAPLLRARCSELSVWAQPKLLRLLSTVPGIDRLLPLHDGSPGVEYDVDIELMEAPFVLRLTLDSLPARVPYLHAPSERSRVAAVTPSPRPNVGIVWRAGEWEPGRSIRFAELKPITGLPFSWSVLQGEPGIAERPPGFGRVVGTTSVDDAAAASAALDLLITVDSMPAHLAGALGTPVWTLLQHHADWRWMDERDDTPWYPTMRLFRQQRAGEWAPVIARVAALLAGGVPAGARRQAG